MSKRYFFIHLSFIFLLAAVAFAGESPYNPNPSPRYTVCTLQDAQAHIKYYSGIFLAGQKNMYPTQNAFLHFVAEKYSYKIQPGVDEYHMPVQCTGWPSSEDASSVTKARIEDDSRNAIKAIQTKWTFGGQKAVEEPSPSNSTSSSSNGAGAQDDKLDSYTMALLQQDPRGLNLSPLDRQFVLSEAPKAKSYCAKDPELSQALDCNCFVRTVFNYRIAHASGPIQQTIFAPLNTLLTKPDFLCSECVRKDAANKKVPCDRANNPHM